MYFCGPVIFGDFFSLKISVVRERIFKGIWTGVGGLRLGDRLG